MCRVERWSTRTLAKKIDSMRYGCSARSRIPSAADPERRDLDIKPMMGRDGYRLRIGRWRALYRIENDRMVILVVEIGSRGDLYK